MFSVKSSIPKRGQIIPAFARLAEKRLDITPVVVLFNIVDVGGILSVRR